jgi:hypothetical protein
MRATAHTSHLPLLSRTGGLWTQFLPRPRHSHSKRRHREIEGTTKSVASSRAPAPAEWSEIVMDFVSATRCSLTLGITLSLFNVT